MPTYVTLANVNEQEFQNAQELAAIWGEIRNAIEELGGELHESYALLGNHDFQFTFGVPDGDAAVQVAMAVESHGLDTETMRAIQSTVWANSSTTSSDGASSHSLRGRPEYC